MASPAFRPRGILTLSRSAILSAIGLSLLCAPAQAAWHQPAGGASPINESPSQNAQQPSLTTIGGVPYVAWSESDGNNNEIRVARLNAAGTAWEKVADSASPINESGSQPAQQPSLSGIGGVPYVAWSEYDTSGNNGNYEIRVARLNAAGTAWEKVADSNSPINKSPDLSAFAPSLTAIGGVPYVAWQEILGVHTEIRVARLNAAGTAWEKVADSASPINKAAQDATDPSLIAIGGVPYVAWSENDGTNTEIRVARLNAAGTAWERVADSASPINESPSRNARTPSLTAIGGVPYVAWDETDGTNTEVRVARPNAAGTAWEKVADSASPINESAAKDASGASLVAIGGVPYVAWSEDDGTNTEVRVARLNAAGTAWEKVAGSPSPINESASRNANETTLTAVGGVPYVAWDESDGANSEIRATRLEPEFVSQAAMPGSTSASLSATWRTYGVEFPIGFDYGASLESSTIPATAPPFADTATITQRVTGLTPSSPYQFRTFAIPGYAPRLQPPNASVFSTTAAPPPSDTTPPNTKITKEPKAKLHKTKAKYKFTSSEPNSTFVCKFDKKKPKPCDAGKLKLKHLEDGRHKFSVYAVDAAGNADKSPAKDKFKVR